jgi:hypothetical protein
MSATIIQVQLGKLESEFATFDETQSDLDNIDDGQLMRDRFIIKTFSTYKARALDIIENVSGTPHSDSTDSKITLPKFSYAPQFTTIYASMFVKD